MLEGNSRTVRAEANTSICAAFRPTTLMKEKRREGKRVREKSERERVRQKDRVKERDKDRERGREIRVPIMEQRKRQG